MAMYPALSNVENCFDSAESESSSRSRTNAKSIQSVEAKRATIDSRVLGWMISSKRASDDDEDGTGDFGGDFDVTGPCLVERGDARTP